MPYYTREMVKYMNKQWKIDHPDDADPNGKQRVTPSNVDINDYNRNNKNENKNNNALTFDEKRLAYQRNLLRLQVERINRLEGAISTSSAKQFSKYEYDIEGEEASIGSRHTTYWCKHSDFNTIPMVLTVFSDNHPNPFYLKVLRHLGKKHPYILQTWDIFIDDNNRILLFQEYANRSDMGSLIKSAPSSNITEALVVDWSRQLFKALDYLGDMGICHRNISPSHVLLSHHEMSVRLSGFTKAYIYWNIKKEDIEYIPCFHISCKPLDEPDYQAPEIYGDPHKEEFDPILADVWSYGAVIFYALSHGKYPHDWKRENKKIEKEIQSRVEQLNVASEGKQFMSSLLSTNALSRIPVNSIGQNAWFARFQDKGRAIGSSTRMKSS